MLHTVLLFICLGSFPLPDTFAFGLFYELALGPLLFHLFDVIGHVDLRENLGLLGHSGANDSQTLDWLLLLLLGLVKDVVAVARVMPVLVAAAVGGQDLDRATLNLLCQVLLLYLLLFDLKHGDRGLFGKFDQRPVLSVRGRVLGGRVSRSTARLLSYLLRM